jgi:hypothetical protein
MTDDETRCPAEMRTPAFASFSTMRDQQLAERSGVSS